MPLFALEPLDLPFEIATFLRIGSVFGDLNALLLEVWHASLLT